MTKKLLDFCIRERLVILIASLLIVVYGWYSTQTVPLDAIPNVGENQVIVLVEWSGRSPKDVEDQITYPLSVALQAVPGAKSVRGKSMFGFSFVQVTFADSVDFYWARSRVAEQLTTVAEALPDGVAPRLAPDATALGQIFYYVLEPPPGMDLAELRSQQDFFIKYALQAVDGVAEVASVGGYEKQYQVDVAAGRELYPTQQVGTPTRRRVPDQNNRNRLNRPSDFTVGPDRSTCSVRTVSADKDEDTWEASICEQGLGMARQPTELWPVVLATLLIGCQVAHPSRDPQYAQVTYAIHQACHAPVAAEAALSPVVPELMSPQPVEAYIGFALAQNAGVQAARQRIEAAAMRVPQAASLEDPMLDVNGWPFFPNVPQTASGRMTVDMMISQEVPWLGKLSTRAAAAEEEVNAARAELAAAELETIAAVKRGYYELYYVQNAILITRQERAVLADLIEVADALYRTGRSSQQDLLRMQAELSSIEGELIRMEQMRAAAQAELAQVLHVSPETPLAAVEELAPEEVPRDLDLLYQRAVAARPELHAMLAEIDRDRRMVELARLEYYPDAAFKFGWGEMTTDRALAPMADGIDNLTVGVTMNLPLYRKRLDAAVREAEATAIASARRYDQLKDETQRDVKQLFTQARSQREMEVLFRESIIPKTRQALDVAVQGYQVGETGFADLIANWRELLQFQLSHLQLEAQLRQTLAALERVVGGLPEGGA